MKALVCGGRDFGYTAIELDLINRAMNRAVESLGVTSIVQGGARGADYHAAQWAYKNSIPVETYKADWGEYGKAAGMTRNQEMLDKAKPAFVIAFPGGNGTADMVRRSEASGLKVYRVGWVNPQKG